ncbi:hypothetical protein Dsin_008856 [Dipteronia sinensis]|uniref:Uncharacterized protein n=1 Tax=Dipteronia sinensis TaxID=43782 RepID=A0AAE0APE2_9ROSI|nr:hypothetical protein Dsin_008856 [Dipteronia sinensis]
MGEDLGVCRVVKQLDQACREAGFFYVKGHGIPESLIKEVKQITRTFFDLPYEEKLKIKLTPAAGYRGYQRIGENITNGKSDMQEAIDCCKEVKKGMYGALGKPMEGCNQWPFNPPNFKSLMEEYINLCTGMFYLYITLSIALYNLHHFNYFFYIFLILSELSRNIMRGIALALCGSPYEFEGERAGDPFWILRIVGYPGVSLSNGHNKEENDIGCGAHTDYGLISMINQDDDITALEARNQSGEWIPVPPIPGLFICNISDMLEVVAVWKWSGGENSEGVAVGVSVRC